MNKDFRGVLLSLNEEEGREDLGKHLNNLRKETYEYGDYKGLGKINEEGEVGSVSITKEKYGKGLSVLWGDTEYRYISDRMETSELYKKAKEELKISEKNLKDFLDEFAIPYWDSNNGGRDSEGNITSSGEAMKAVEDTLNIHKDGSVSYGTVDEEVSSYEPLNEESLQEGYTVEVNGIRYVVGSYEGHGYYLLEPEDKRRSEIYIKSTSEFKIISKK